MLPRSLAPAVALVALMAAPSVAETFPGRVVTVAFAKAPGDPRVQELHALMGTRTIKRHDDARWAFGLPAHGEANDWSLFFAQLADVKHVTPAPRTSPADAPPPPVVLGPASPGPGAPGPGTFGTGALGPGMYLPTDKIFGSDVLVRYRATFAEEAQVAARVDRIYGTRSLGRTESGEFRLAPPKGATPQLTARVLRLCPVIASAEPAWGR